MRNIGFVFVIVVVLIITLLDACCPSKSASETSTSEEERLALIRRDSLREDSIARENARRGIEYSIREKMLPIYRHKMDSMNQLREKK